VEFEGSGNMAESHGKEVLGSKVSHKARCMKIAEMRGSTWCAAGLICGRIRNYIAFEVLEFDGQNVDLSVDEPPSSSKIPV
jgi:hypothetical protein